MAARPGNTAKMTVNGRTPKTSGTIMAISFFSGRFHQLTLGGVANILRLGPEDISKGCPPLHCHDDPVDESHQGPQVGPRREPLQRFDERFSGPGFPKNQLKFRGEFAV